MTSGRFISLEGGEGTGKSTQIGLLADRLRTAGHEVVITREPGGSPGAEDIRALLLTGDPDRWDAMTEALLLFAARRDHVERLIRPALQRGAWVISDRFADSTVAYQGEAHGQGLGLGRERIMDLWKFTLGDFRPDLTLILDLPHEEGLRRATERMAGDDAAEDRFERMGDDFHERQREAYLETARLEPERCIVVDATGSADEVQQRIWGAVQDRLEV